MTNGSKTMADMINLSTASGGLGSVGFASLNGVF
jgi:hypothetical protein